VGDGLLLVPTARQVVAFAATAPTGAAGTVPPTSTTLAPPVPGPTAATPGLSTRALAAIIVLAAVAVAVVVGGLFLFLRRRRAAGGGGGEPGDGTAGPGPTPDGTG
jgi:hypothetical protein